MIKTRHFRRKTAENDAQRKALKEQMKAYEAEMVARECEVFKRMMAEIHAVAGTEAVDPSTRQKVGVSDNVEVISEQIDNFDIAWINPASARGAAQKLVNQYWPKITALKEESRKQVHEGIRIYKERIRRYLSHMTPFYPLGLPPSMADTVSPVAVGLRDTERAFVAVWRLAGEDTILIPDTSGGKASLLYPAGLGIELKSLPGTVEIKFPRQYMAAIVEITKEKP